MRWTRNAGVSFLSGVVGGLLAIVSWLWLKGAADSWVGFAGSIISGVMTLAAAAYAFNLTRKQVDMQAAELKGMNVEEARRARAMKVLVLQMAFELKETAAAMREKITTSGIEFIEVRDIEEFPLVEKTIDVREIWRINTEIVIKVHELKTSIFSYNNIKRRENDSSKIPIFYPVNWLRTIEEECIDIADYVKKYSEPD